MLLRGMEERSAAAAPAVGALVWAKMKGSPHWPAQVTKPATALQVHAPGYVSFPGQPPFSIMPCRARCPLPCLRNREPKSGAAAAAAPAASRSSAQTTSRTSPMAP